MNRISSDLYSSDRLFRTLTRLEDTVICALTERAQSGLNRSIYIPGDLGFNNMIGNRSFLEYFLWETEKMQGTKAFSLLELEPELRCTYSSFILSQNEFHPFTSPLPLPSARSCGRGLSLADSKRFLCANNVNVNEDIMQVYIKYIVPSISKNQDDGHYRSSATLDIECLEALSRRIHYAKFIAESRYQADPEIYTRLARANDRQGIHDQLTNRYTELRTLGRLGRKAVVYGQTLDQEGRTPAQQVIRMYDQWVTPLAKQVEIDYLIIRGLSSEEG